MPTQTSSSSAISSEAASAHLAGSEGSAKEEEVRRRDGECGGESMGMEGMSWSSYFSLMLSSRETGADAAVSHAVAVMVAVTAAATVAVAAAASCVAAILLLRVVQCDFKQLMVRQCRQSGRQLDQCAPS